MTAFFRHGYPVMNIARTGYFRINIGTDGEIHNQLRVFFHVEKITFLRPFQARSFITIDILYNQIMIDLYET